MNFSRLTIILDQTIMDKFYRRDFTFRQNFITYYLSRKIAAKHIACDVAELTILAGSNVRKVSYDNERFLFGVPFNRNAYENAARTNDSAYFCEFIREAIREAISILNFPAAELLSLLDEFEEKNFINEWQYKSDIVLKEFDLKVRMMQVLTTDAYTLEAHFYSISQKRELCSGTIFRTLPDRAYFLDTFKDVTPSNDKLIIYQDFYGYRIGSIDINQILGGTFNFTYSDGDDLNEWERDYLLANLKRQLSYKGNSFYYGEYKTNK